MLWHLNKIENHMLTVFLKGMGEFPANVINTIEKILT